LTGSNIGSSGGGGGWC